MLTGEGGDDPSSSTGSAGTNTDVWHIVDGLQEHIVQYIEDWDCCNGDGESQIETLISRTPVIFAGTVCTPITCGTCVVDTSSV
jgi:hypothetical protein